MSSGGPRRSLTFFLLLLLSIIFLPESHNEYKYEHYSRDIHKHAAIWNNNEQNLSPFFWLVGPFVDLARACA